MWTRFHGAAAVLAALALLLPPVRAAADALACQRTILKAGSAHTRARLKALQRCEDRTLAGRLPVATDCLGESKTASALAKAERRLRARLARSCGGADRACGTADDEPPAALGWPGACPDFEGRGCTNAIAHCGDVGDCLGCVGAAVVDQAVSLHHDGLAPTPDRDLARCRRAIGKEMARLLDTRTKALVRCWDGRLEGQHAGACPSPGDGKAALTIAQAEAKARAKVCRACGGTDRTCGGGDDLSPPAIGFPPFCPDVGGCGGLVGDLDALIACGTCVSELEVGCAVPLAVPAFAPYPAACNAPRDCPTVLRLDGNGTALDLDVGWNGLAHDLDGPWLGRLTLALLGCAGDGDPSCGTCTLAGPVDNAGGAAFATRRCADRPWVGCGGDADCAAAGAAGPCRFFLGPPQPVGIGGITSCTLTEITGPVTGTVDVETGALAAALPLVMRSHDALTSFPGMDVNDPCPRCVNGTCDAGPRQGMACTVQGHSTTFADDLSLDCPPAVELGRVTAIIPLSTEPQVATVSATSPRCTAVGYSALRCLCDTCDNAAAQPCAAHADCPESVPGTPGVCGGARCLPPSTNLGAPCAAPSACTGGPCGTLTETTAPNPCFDGHCTPTVGDEGECVAGPYDGYCEPAEPFRGCLAASECPTPGDVCVFRARGCFVGDGVVGMSVSAAAAADPPVGGAFAPRLAGLTCIRPLSPPPSLDNPPRGLPGLGRFALDVAATLE